MKKKYEKPIVLIEDYSMSEICAGSPCEAKLNFKDPKICYYDKIGFDDDGVMTYLFNRGNKNCEGLFMDDRDQYDGICYHGPNDTNNFFAS